MWKTWNSLCFVGDLILSTSCELVILQWRHCDVIYNIRYGNVATESKEQSSVIRFLWAKEFSANAIHSWDASMQYMMTSILRDQQSWIIILYYARWQHKNKKKHSSKMKNIHNYRRKILKEKQ